MTTYVASNSAGTAIFTSNGVALALGVVPTLGVGDTLTVLSGAVASGVTATGVTSIAINSGGELLNSTINNSTLVVSSGAVASGNTENSTYETVSSGGSSINETVIDTYDHAGGLSVASGGTLTGVSVSSGGNLAITSGALVSGLSIGNGATVSPAVTSGTAVSAGAATTTVGGGTLYTASLSGGVTVYTYLSGATTITTTTPPVLQSGDTLNITSGAVASGVQSTDTGIATVNISAGGELLSSTINNGFTNVASGGVASGNIENSTVETVASGGRSVNETQLITVGDTVGGLTVQSGGIATGDTAVSGATITVNAGGVANGTTIGSGGVLTNFGTVSGATVSNGGTLTNNNVVSAAIVSSGGILSNTGTSTVSGSTISSGGAYVGSSTGALTVASGAAASFAPGGTVYNATLSAGVTVYTYTSGSSTITTPTPPVLRSGDVLNISAGAVASGVQSVVGGIATVNVKSGGELLSSTINNGYTFVSSGGVASGNTLISDEGTTYTGGALTNNTIVGGASNNGGADTYTVQSGAIATGDTTLSGGTIATATGAIVSALTIGSGGSFTNGVGNTLTGVTVASGGHLTNLGTVTGGTVASGGFASNTGTATGITVASGGAYAGPATGVTVASGGAATTVGGGTLYTASLSGGVTVYTYLSGITTIKTTTPPVLQSGDTLNITSGAVASGVQSTDTGIATVNVGAGGELLSSTINNGFTNVSSGGVASGNIENSTVETVASGGRSVNETQLITVGDTLGGLTVQSGGIATGDTVVSGGTITVNAGGVANGSTVGTGGALTNNGFMSGTTVSGSSVASTGVIANNGIAEATTIGSGGYLSNSTAGTALGTTVNAGGAAVSLAQIACFLAGTRIATPRGELPVETLRIGDTVSLASGGTAPIKWIGHRAYHPLLAAKNPDVQPVLIRAGALDAGVPARDLYVSRTHALYLDGVLIHACELVNGVSVIEGAPVERLAYFHIELDRHAIILAEGTPTESYAEYDNRGIFQNAAQYASLFPMEAERMEAFCAPLTNDGPVAAEARRRIGARAGLPNADDAKATGMLLGYVDHVGATEVRGWARDSVHVDVPVRIDIYDRNRLVAFAVADHYRQDLARAQTCGGRHGFRVRLPAGHTLEAVDVRRAWDGQLLPGSVSLARRAAV